MSPPSPAGAALNPPWLGKPLTSTWAGPDAGGGCLERNTSSTAKRAACNSACAWPSWLGPWSLLWGPCSKQEAKCQVQ